MLSIDLATRIHKALTENIAQPVTLLEVRNMTPIITDAYEVYALQQGDVTVLAWVRKDGSIVTKTCFW